MPLLFKIGIRNRSLSITGSKQKRKIIYHLKTLINSKFI